jgi:TraM recognition site of TraD and TraG
VFQEMRQLDEKTRSNVLATFGGIAHPFAKGRMFDLFCTDTTVVPELAQEGAVIIVDLPVKQWESTGILAQSVWKYLFQKATERRDVQANPRPVFLWADEAQFFLSEYDNEFQSTARSARAATVYLTQNLSGVYTSIGGKHPEHAADALTGNLRTKIFHSNDNQTTNRWAAELIGKVMHWRENRSAGQSTNYGENAGRSGGSSGGSFWNMAPQPTPVTVQSGWSRGESWGRGQSVSHGASQQLDYDLQPDFFSRSLRCGGKGNGYMVDAVVFQSGREDGFSENGGKAWTLASFPQRGR